MVLKPFKPLLILTLISLYFSGCATQSSPAVNNSGLHEISTLHLPMVGGGEMSLNQYSGKIVMLHFFSSWCTGCAAEAPSLRNLYMSFKDSKFQIIGVAIDDDQFDTQVFVSKYSLPYPVVSDTEGDLKDFFQIKELPTTLFLSKNSTPIHFKDPQTGETTAMLVGPRAWDSVKPVEMIAGLVQ